MGGEVPDVHEILPGEAWRLVSPMPAPLEAVNLYLFRTEDGYLLVDTGIRSRRSLAVLREGLRAVGAALEDLRHLVLTHAHVDHLGLARRVVEAAGGRVRVYAHPHTRLLAGIPFQPLEPAEHPALAFFRSLGVPEGSALQLLSMENYMLQAMQDPLPVDRAVEDAQVLDFPPFRFRVRETPGHCPGHIALVEEARGWAFWGDHLHRDRLPVCPLPLYPPRPLELGALLVENPRDLHLRSLPTGPSTGGLGLHLPGHGPPFQGLRPVLASYRSRWEGRCRAVVEACLDEPRDPYTLGSILYGEHNEVMTLLTVSETLYTVIDQVREGALEVATPGEAGVLRLLARGPARVGAAWLRLPDPDPDPGEEARCSRANARPLPSSSD
ncbi:MAG: MBL fold metallo-hydrolase [Planctomycetes bacterium]|nr:MBL fold metallo-hydrolase [Planctomycetota bacterium]